LASALTPEDRSLRARAAAFSMHSQHDSRETTARGRAAFLAKFLDEVDPDRTLPEDERNRRAEHARSAYFARLSYKSARARRQKSEAGSEQLDHREVLGAIKRYGPVTEREIAQRLHEDFHSVQRARIELERRGLIEAEGRKLEGGYTIAWTAVP